MKVKKQAMWDYVMSTALKAIGGSAGFLVVGVTVLLAQSVANFATNTRVSARAMNANFGALDGRLTSQDTRLTTTENAITKIAPVGAIVAWHEHLGPGTIELPAGWLQCNGQLIVDSESPFDGQNLPDLNNARRFLRGNITSGPLEADQFAQHTHRNNVISRYGHATWIDHTAGFTDLSSPWGGPEGLANAFPGGNANIGYAGTPGETRPINMSVVWIIRIK